MPYKFEQTKKKLHKELDRRIKLTNEDREEMIKFIYSIIADKTLSQWCKIYFEDIVPHDRIIVYNEWNKKFSLDWLTPTIIMDYQINPRRTRIIWHPVGIWDVLDYNYNNFLQQWNDWTPFWEFWYYQDIAKDIFDNWKFKRKPIENQSEECIEYIYNLI